MREGCPGVVRPDLPRDEDDPARRREIQAKKDALWAMYRRGQMR